MMKTFLCSVVLLGLVGSTSIAGSSCDCATCGEEDQIDWVCVPQVVNRTLDVVEWGVVDAPVCRTPCKSCCRLSHGKTRSACDGAACDSAACDGGCAEAGHASHVFGPRLRKKLMRKKLVYSVPVIEYVARPRCRCCEDCDLSGVCAQRTIDASTRTTPADQLASRDDKDESTYWLNLTKIPSLTKTPSVVRLEPRAVATAEMTQAPVADETKSETNRPQAKVFWIDGRRDSERSESVTMSNGVMDTSPAPIATQPGGSSPKASRVKWIRR